VYLQNIWILIFKKLETILKVFTVNTLWACDM